MTSRKKFSLLLVLFSIFSFFCFSENLTDNGYEYSLDIPEGFNMTDYSEDGHSYLLTHPNNNVNLAVKISTVEKTNSKTILQDNLNKLKAKYEAETFKWNNKDSAIASFEMTLDKEYEGWSVSVPLKATNSYISLICYSSKENFKYCEQFIMSTLNSLCVDFEQYNTPGIIVSYAFPKEGTKKVTLKIANKQINTTIDKVDEEASQFLVDLEYGVLCLYAKHNLWKEAWQRYYRLIYRDSYGRLNNVCEDVWQALYPMAHKKDADNAEIIYAQYLLDWVQGFQYLRGEEKTSSDFTALPSVICGKGNDCDSRSMLLCVFLKSMGIESLLLISQAYSHAMCATEIEAPGQVYTLEGTDRYFIYGETTAKVTWGMIAQDFVDQSKWIPVILP